MLRPAAYAHRERAEQLLSRAIEVMRLRQKEEPWTLGVTSLALARALGVDESLLLRVLSAFAEEGLISHHSGYFSSIDHVPKLAAEQQAFFEGLVPVHAALEFVPVPLEDVVRAVKQSRITGIGRAFDTLLAKGTLVKVNDDLYRGTQIAAINARVQTYLRANERMTMAQFRDLIGTTRKYAVPLLEWFDSRGITVRSGDYRMLRSKT